MGVVSSTTIACSTIRRKTAIAISAGLLAAPLAVTVATAPPSGAVLPTSNLTVDVSNREAVRTFYNVVHAATDPGIPMGWTGSIARCDPGTISQDYLDATLTRINYFRAMAGVATNVTFTAANNATAQATALLMSAQGQLSHDPPNTWKCWTQQARDGAATSNLAIGSTGPVSIDNLMYDGGYVGHRRWILFPPTITMGSGSIPAHDAGSATEANLVIGQSSPTQPPARDTFVAWPPKGFVPYQVVYPRWSFGLDGAKFDTATVTMTRGGTPLPVTIQSRNESSTAGPHIVWSANGLADGASWPRPTADDPITVTIANVVVNGTPQTFTYTTTIIDPAVPGAGTVTPVVSGPATVPAGTTASYGVTQLPGASGYQWRSMASTPLTFTDGAETGLVNFDASVVPTGAYNPVDTSNKATGGAAFRLSGSGFSNPSQTLTLRKTLLASSTTQLAFSSDTELIDSMAARVEVSTDGGASWSTVDQQTPTGRQGAFARRTVSLASLAGRTFQLRFNLAYTGGSTWTCCGSLGWYIDDVGITGAQDTATPSVSAVGPPTFTLNATQAGTVLVQARPQYFGLFFGDWSAALAVAVQGPAAAPVITTQPAPQVVNAGGNATFTVAATGTPAPTFAWALNGTPLADGPGIAGSASATLSLSNVQAAQAGTYTVTVANSGGTVTSLGATLTVNAALTLASALNATALTWTTSGDAPWSPQTAVSHDLVSAAQSGAIGDSQTSSLQTTVNGPAAVSFWWQVDSEQDFDFLSVDVDGTVQQRISGNVAWQQITVNVPAGAHVVRWQYAKDTSASAGRDAGWVDQVTVTPA